MIYQSIKCSFKDSINDDTKNIQYQTLIGKLPYILNASSLHSLQSSIFSCKFSFSILYAASNFILEKTRRYEREKEGEMMKFLSRLWNVQNIVLVLSWNNEMEERVFGVS